ncbi:magnesium transporter [Xanthovirga aplysinae]|uniref:magnesium transporter n=1 Tax=Xanthovirga aplysinae TaxID=2529853 RepID=UPI0012BD497F|nr:magnesium transporter [Xanthovirga aplysinae]MTI33595.1 magnesium transporter [Xanthovirga aplysinae]
MQFELSKEFLEWFKERVEIKESNEIFTSLDGANPADISTLLDEFGTSESKYVIDLLERDTGAEIIRDLDPDKRLNFLKAFEPLEIASYVSCLDSDDAADILNKMPVKTREEVIAGLEDGEKAANIVELLRYEDDCAGGLMAKELIKANLNWTVVQCIEEIRRQAENVQKIYSVYVVDEMDRLLGRVSLKQMLLAGDKKKIADLYTSDIVSVQTFLNKEEVADLMRKYDLDAVPVINVQGKLVGRITIDDIVDVITELAEQERQLMSGISQDVEEDDSVWRLTRARLPWLLIGVFGGMIGAQIMSGFEGQITAIPMMAFFVPLITATGGNVGIQSSSIILQSLAHRTAFDEDGLNRFLKVLMVALLNGLALAAVVMSANVLIGKDTYISFVVSAALFTVVLLASFTGTLTPLILDRIGINPALASGPFITTANDILGLTIYFLVAQVLI